jgi:hypothetical protein
MYFENLISGEQFYLWLHLSLVLNPRSCEDLRTVNCTVYDTFHRVGVALGLLEDDLEWIECFNEAVLFARGSSLRRLFVMALAYGGISHPMGIREQFRNHFCNDITPRQL